MTYLDAFWHYVFPALEGYEFLYVFLDFLSIYVIIEAVIVIPGILLLGRDKNLWKD